MSLAAAYIGLDIEYIDGVAALSDKALPPGQAQREAKEMNEGTIFAWRAHMITDTYTSSSILQEKFSVPNSAFPRAEASNFHY